VRVRLGWRGSDGQARMADGEAAPLRLTIPTTFLDGCASGGCASGGTASGGGRTQCVPLFVRGEQPRYEEGSRGTRRAAAARHPLRW